MAEKESIYGIKYEVDIEELKKSTSEAGKQIRQANAEFNEASSKMDNWAQSADGLEAKIKQLNTILAANKTKIAQSKDEYNKTLDTIDSYQRSIDELKAKKQQAIATYGRESAEVAELEQQISKLERQQATAVNSADRLKASITNQQAVINRTERSIGSYGERLDEVKQAQQRAEKSGRSLEEELNDIRKASSEAGEASKEMSGGFSVMKGAIAGLISGGISKVVSGLSSLVEESKEYIKIQGALETSSKLAGYTAEETAQTYKQLYGVLGDEQTTATTVSNLQAMGLNQEQLTQLTEGAIGAWAKYGDSIPIDGLAEAINETAKVGTVTGTFADVLNWAGTSEDEFNKKLAECGSESERANLILEELSRQGLTQSAQDFRENSSALIEANEAQAKWQETTSRAAEMVMPVMSKVKSAAAGVLSTFLDLASGNISFEQVVGKVKEMGTNVINTVTTLGPALAGKGLEMLTSLSGGLVKGIPNVTGKFLELIQGLGDTLARAAPGWIEKGFEMLSNLAQGLTNALPGLIEKVPQIISTFANVINDNFPTILAKGAELLWQIIQGIVSAIPTLIANIPQIISAIVDTLMAFQWLNLGKTVIQFLGNGVMSMVGFVRNAGTSILNGIKGAIQNLPSTLANIGRSAMSGLGNAISGAIGTVKSAASNIVSGIASTLQSLPGRMLSIGKDLVRGLWNGISDMTGWIIDKIQGFGSSVLNGIKSFFGINSPSKETYWMGKMLDEGLGNAIADGTKKVVKKARDMAGQVLGNMKTELQEGIGENMSVLVGVRGNMQRAAARKYPQPAYAGEGGDVNNITFNQYNTSPKPIDSLETYRNTRRQLKELEKWKKKR